MVSYIHLFLVINSSLVVLAIWRFWYCINRMGFTKEVGRLAPELARGDILAVTFASQPIVLAIIDWFQIVLPNQSHPLPSAITVFLSIACFCGCVCVLRNSHARLSGHWAGAREGALRTVAALRIISAAELRYVMNNVNSRTQY